MQSVINDLHFAWKTVILSLIAQIFWIAIVGLVLTNKLDFIIGMILLSLSTYLNFTPMHEASHGNISGKNKKLKFINSIIGHSSSLSMFIPFTIFKLLHLQHHSHTNKPELDPDYWVATRNPFILFFKIFTIKIGYYFHVFFRPKSSVKNARISILYSFSIYYSLIAFVEFYSGKGLIFISLWFGSAVIALALLALVFDWLPHNPHKKIGRWIDTIIIDKSWLTYPLLYQNYHLCHHLYPRVPFYQYKKLFIELENEMVTRGSKVIR